MIIALKKDKIDSKDIFSIQRYTPPLNNMRYLVCFNLDNHICKAKQTSFTSYYTTTGADKADLKDMPKPIKENLISLTTSLAMNLNSSAFKIEEITAEWMLTENGSPILLDLPYISILMKPEKPLHQT